MIAAVAVAASLAGPDAAPVDRMIDAGGVTLHIVCAGIFAMKFPREIAGIVLVDST